MPWSRGPRAAASRRNGETAGQVGHSVGDGDPSLEPRRCSRSGRVSSLWAAVVLTGISTGLAASALTRLLALVQHIVWGGSGRDLLQVASRSAPARHVLLLLGRGATDGCGSALAHSTVEWQQHRHHGSDLVSLRSAACLTDTRNCHPVRVHRRNGCAARARGRSEAGWLEPQLTPTALTLLRAGTRNTSVARTKFASCNSWATHPQNCSNECPARIFSFGYYPAETIAGYVRTTDGDPEGRRLNSLLPSRT